MPDFGSNQHVDDSVWQSTLLNRLGIALQSLTNEFVQCIQFICNPTNSTASYEKTGVIIEGQQKDSSTYPQGAGANEIDKDAVGLNTTMRISGGTKTGRAFSSYVEAGVDPNSDGFSIGQEIGMHNQGSEQPALDTSTTKIGLEMVAGEYPDDKKVTAARHIDGGHSKWFNGDVFERDAFASDDSSAIAIRDRAAGGKVIFRITAAGRFIPRFEVAPNQPAMTAGELMVWGDSANGVTFLVFFDGGNFLRTRLDPGL